MVAGTSAPAYTGVGTVPSSGCQSIFNSAPLSIKLVDPGCGCELLFSLPLGGTNSSVTSDCAAQGCSQCHPSNPTTQISVLPISPSLTCDEKYTIVIQ